jgi:hypothetical protein
MRGGRAGRFRSPVIARSVPIDASALFCRSYSNAVRLDRHNRTGAQPRAVLPQDFSGSRSVSFSSEAHETHDAPVREPTDDREFSEVLVDRDDDLRSVEGAVENSVSPGSCGQSATAST